MPNPSNTAAWQPEPGVALEVKPTPYTSPGEHEIVVRNVAIAVNPIDWIIQDRAMFDWLEYPLVPGSDVAGEVVEIGRGVSRFKLGDRVLAQATGDLRNEPARSAFQQYTVVAENMAAHIPDTIDYANAVVLPLGLGTASCGLFEKDQLALQYPSVLPKPTGKTLLIWGGSSSVGCNGIQLAVAAGYEVVSTASPKNFDLLKQLGASHVWDYNSENIVEQLVQALKGKTIAGALHTVGDSEKCFAVVERCSGQKFVSTTLPISESKPANVDAKQIFGSTLKDNEVSRAVYVDFLANALSEGTYVPAPEPWIVGTGLESLQKGLEIQKQGVSAKKVIITLE